MNVYLAGPWPGYPGQNRQAFNAGAARLRSAGHTVFNPAEHSPADEAETIGSIRSLLGADLAWITSTADAVVLLPGWETSLGATAEWSTARAIGIVTAELDHFLNDHHQGRDHGRAESDT
jgi:Domain of unknown function (DUF4406)